MGESDKNQDEIKENPAGPEDKDQARDDDQYEKVCYICRRPESKAGTMISMPGGMNLCHDCMQKAFDTVTKSGMDLSKLPGMPYMNMNLNEMNLNQPGMEIPKKQKIRKKADKQPALSMKASTARPGFTCVATLLGGRLKTWRTSRSCTASSCAKASSVPASERPVTDAATQPT